MSIGFLAPHHHIIVFDGADAATFLQSQLTNDVSALLVGEWQWQGYCNAKGRLYATFPLARLTEASFAAVVHESVSEFIVKRLTMFRLRAKLSLARSDRHAALLHLAAPSSTPPADGARLALGHDRWLDIIADTQKPYEPASPELLHTWALRGIEAKQPEIVAGTQERFVPQMIGFDTITPKPGVSFSKGCYPGQEVVARAHYRGAVKRELVLLNVPVEPPIHEGHEVLLPDGEIAEIVNCVPEPHQWRSLAVVPIKERAPVESSAT